MSPTENPGKWMSLSGSRRRPPGAVSGGQREDRPESKELPQAGPVDGIEAIRGVLFFGILAFALWLEWLAVKALTIYISSIL